MEFTLKELIFVKTMLWIHGFIFIVTSSGKAIARISNYIPQEYHGSNFIYMACMLLYKLLWRCLTNAWRVLGKNKWSNHTYHIEGNYLSMFLTYVDTPILNNNGLECLWMISQMMLIVQILLKYMLPLQCEIIIRSCDNFVHVMCNIVTRFDY